MTTFMLVYSIATLLGGLVSGLSEAGSRDQSRLVDLIGALVAGCFFGTMALFVGRWVLGVEALLGLAWVSWAQLQRRRPARRRIR